LLPVAPTPTISSTSVIRSADCNTYTFTFNYKNNIGTDIESDFDIEHLDTTTYEPVFTAKAATFPFTEALTYSDFGSTYGYYLGTDI
jgi:hypothetical protein